MTPLRDSTESRLVIWTAFAGAVLWYSFSLASISRPSFLVMMPLKLMIASGAQAAIYLWFSDPILARFRDVLAEGFFGDPSFFFAGAFGFLGVNPGAASTFSSFSLEASTDFAGVAGNSGFGSDRLKTSWKATASMSGRNFCRSDVTSFLAT